MRRPIYFKRFLRCGCTSVFKVQRKLARQISQTPYWESTHAIQSYQDITISNMLVLGLTALVVFKLMHQTPSAYIVAQRACYLNEAMHHSIDMYIVKWAGSAAVALVYAARTTEDPQCGRGISCSSSPNKTTFELAFQHLSILALFVLSFWITRLRSQGDLWIKSAYQSDFCFVLSSTLLPSLCSFSPCVAL